MSKWKREDVVPGVPSYRGGETPCPKCGKVLDAVSNLHSDAVPEPGDFSICGGCASVLRFTEGGMDIPSIKELRELPKKVRQQLEKMQRLVRATNAQFKKFN